MPRVVKSLDLFASVPVEAPRCENRPALGKSQLWIAVSMPSLALECLAAADLLEPAVVIEAEQGQLHVVASNRAAVDAGIVAGTKLGTALALEASLQVFERAPPLEIASLESLASWAETLTSMVSLEPPESLLLEVAGSLRLFGSLEAIKAKLSEELARRYRDFRFCVAPTATAALWLARAASSDVLQWQQLAGRLAALPLAVTRWPPAVQALLRDLGLRTIGDCVRLPRDGFARRVGRSYLLELDRAFGRANDLRAEFKAPKTWSSSTELSEESVDSAVFLEAIEQLLAELAVELRRRQAQIGSLEISFEHLHRPPTVESFDLREPTHDRDRLLRLIEDRLERSALPVPAVALRIESGAFRPLEIESRGFVRDEAPRATRAAIARAAARAIRLRRSLRATRGCRAPSGKGLGEAPERRRPSSAPSCAVAGQRSAAVVAAADAGSARGSPRVRSSSAPAQSASRAVGGTSTTSPAITTWPKTRRVRSYGCFAIVALAVGSCMASSAERSGSWNLTTA